jgi:hypothetical protein
MLILTEENLPYNLDCVPEEVDGLRYCVLDCSNPKNIDFYWLPLIFLESFNAPAVVLEMGEFRVPMPLDWSMLVCDDSYSDMEVMPLTSLNDRGFHTVAFNPLHHLVPIPLEVNIVNIYADVKWFFPKLKNGNVLVMPLEQKPRPKCALFVKEGNKVPDPLDMALLFGG